MTRMPNRNWKAAAAVALAAALAAASCTGRPGVLKKPDAKANWLVPILLVDLDGKCQPLKPEVARVKADKKTSFVLINYCATDYEVTIGDFTPYTVGAECSATVGKPFKTDKGSGRSGKPDGPGEIAFDPAGAYGCWTYIVQVNGSRYDPMIRIDR